MVLILRLSNNISQKYYSNTLKKRDSIGNENMFVFGLAAEQIAKARQHNHSVFQVFFLLFPFLLPNFKR
jgi:hypothetical protein